MIICWVYPVSSSRGVKLRQICLRVLDALGKWSLLDTYVMVLFMVAFRFHIVPPTEQGSVAIDVYVTPDLGFYTFLIATMLSLVMTHIILALDRQSTTKEVEIHSSERSSLMNHSFKFDNEDFNLALKWLVLFGLVLGIGLVLTGISAPSFQFNFEGLAGWALQFLGLSTSNSYSVLSVGGLLTSSGPDGPTPGLFLIQISFFIFAILMPIFHLIVLATLWAMPMTFRWQKIFFVTAEVTNAWAALEVFVVSILAGM